MSSMLKKTGGLSFKPKAGRRPGAPRPSAQPASTSSTPAPTTESQSQSQSQSSTPAPSNAQPPTPTVVDPTSIPTTEPTEPVGPPPSKPTTQPPPVVQERPAPPIPQSPPHTEQPSDPPEAVPAEKTAPSIQVPPTPTTNRDVASTREAHPTPTPDQQDQPTQSIEKEVRNLDINTNASRKEHAPTQRAATPLSPSVEESAIAGRLTAPPSPSPRPDTIVAIPPEEPEPTRPAAAKKKAPRKRKSVTADGGTEADGSAPKRKRQRKQPSAETNQAGTTPAPKKQSRRKQLPEDAESQTVDHTTMTVGELTKDLGIGKPFKHAEEIEDRAREARAKYRLKKLERDKRRMGLLPAMPAASAAEEPDAADENGSRGAALAEMGAAAMDSGAGQGVGYDVVDGQIVVHAASLIVNRHNQDMSNLEVVEENEFTNLINSASFSKKPTGANFWTDEDTEKFYRLLGMFGTDFETISNLFPDKTRRAIKLKFNKEERLRPNRVNAAMMVRGEKRVGIDLEAYKATQEQWQTKDKILAEHAKLAEEHEREIEQLRQERQAAGLIDDDGMPTAKASAAGKKGKESAAPGDNGGDGGDEMEVIEEDADQMPEEQVEEQDPDVDMDQEDEHEHDQEHDEDGGDEDDDA
ncbi:hypothetical protein F5Y16DRAFT_368966 [Xylariaceae sp. FL0255]|nr:hypothetical protein F5Y16DRAFT_368966 [Xylariaceae sp. FL0255]